MSRINHEMLITNRGLHNLSHKQLNWYEECLLAKGTKFIATHAPSFKAIHDNYNASMSELSNTLHFRLTSDPAPSFSSKLKLPKSKPKKHIIAFNNKKQQQPDIIDYNLERYIDLTKQTLDKHLSLLQNTISKAHVHYNISKNEIQALKNLENDTSIVCKPADKNLGLCIVDKSWYDNEVLRQLNDSKTYKAYRNPLMCNQALLHAKNKIISCIKKSLPFLNDNDRKYLEQSCSFIENAKTPQIYLLIKVHKSPIAGRPIVPSFNSITAPLSKWLDYKLQPLARQHIKTIVKDSRTIIQHLETNSFPQDCILATADITSLYTMIPTNLGLQYIREFLIYTQTPASLINTMTEFLTLVLQCNFFQYSKVIYQQIQGTAMGTAVAPIYADIFMGFLEKRLVSELTDKGILLFYKRYIDDSLFIFNNHGMNRIQNVADDFNKLHSNIIFNFE